MMRKQNLIGIQFGVGIVFKKVGVKYLVLGNGKRYSRVFWGLQCSCGKQYEASTTDLNRGGIKSCGCRRTFAKRDSLIGMRFGKGTVIKHEGTISVGKKTHGASIWRLICDCGKEYIVRRGHLKSGGVLSCGCIGNNKELQVKIHITSTKYLCRIAKEASKRNLIFTINEQNAISKLQEQNFQCALSGQSIKIEDGSASLDRIDSKKGYILENIQWIYRPLQFMKSNFSQSFFVQQCKYVAEYLQKNPMG